jgi:hypothetical protein
MIRLEKALAAWPSLEFRTTLKEEIERLDPDLLPLQEGLSQSSHVVADNLAAIILSIRETPEKLLVQAGLSYAGIISGCSCADDPTPVNEIDEYCVVDISIDRQTGVATVALATDD